ncbi:uncharacterized protein LOC124304479 isoform X1 [Neodiprion virginianus]|uniref:uncharacterized protein LOC124304479 isoform X1 n=1 Tax=Neodiprion virginianus TaxID=2961670 RepID=UPI001EE6CC06|nr:uncharacterized protein LOC124304479 isoform X1 [Neodiprion virginianus]
MNSKEDSNGQSCPNGDTRIEGQQEANENRSSQCEGGSHQAAKIPNRLTNDQFKMNNNIGEENEDLHLSPQSSCTFANGPQNPQTNNSSSNMGPDHLNTNSTCTAYLDTSQSNAHTNMTSPYILVYPKSTPIYSNSVFPSAQTNVANASTSMAENGSKEDTDIRNNVDYGSGIEKCPPKVACSAESSADGNPIWNTTSFVPNRGMNNFGSSIGSTSQGTCCFLRPNINGSREAAGPSGLQRMSPREGDRRDSSSGNEGDMSDGEDCCFYTYKGMDDPTQLDFRQQLGPIEGQREEREAEPQYHSGSSSPEMDFLEMDFDPGPSCEQDTGDSDMASINEDIQNIALDSVEPDPVPLNDLSSGRVASRLDNVPSNQQPTQNSEILNQRATQSCSNQECSFNQIPNQPSSSHWMPSTSSRIDKWEATGLHRATLCPLQESYGHHNTNGDLISPGDSRDTDAELWSQDTTGIGGSIPESSNLDSRKVNLSSTLYHRMMAKKLMLNKQTAFNQSGDSNLESELGSERSQDLLPVEKIMLWSEQEATVKQVTQIATSACGATAAINALLALDVAFSLEVLVRGVATRLREPGTPLPMYLMSRSMAGATHKDLARGMSLATSGAVVTKFFALYPERKISFSHWLHYWISKGAVPIATLNLQHCGEGANIPDAWHHQMIFGVGPAGIYLSNPLQCLSEQAVWHQLVSPSILLIRRQDVLAHWSTNTDLRPLSQLGQRWRKLNVLGQIVNLVRETMGQRRQSSGITTSITHIRIPASYRAGITLVMRSDAAGAAELLQTEQLPVL